MQKILACLLLAALCGLPACDRFIGSSYVRLHMPEIRNDTGSSFDLLLLFADNGVSLFEIPPEASLALWLNNKTVYGYILGSPSAPLRQVLVLEGKECRDTLKAHVSSEPDGRYVLSAHGLAALEGQCVIRRRYTEEELRGLWQAQKPTEQDALCISLDAAFQPTLLRESALLQDRAQAKDTSIFSHCAEPGIGYQHVDLK